MQNRELNTCKQDIYSFLRFSFPTKPEPYGFGGTDDYGLSLVPGGTYATSLSKDASAATKICVLWLADESPTDAAKGVRRMLQHDKPGSARGCDDKAKGQSLRCVKN